MNTKRIGLIEKQLAIARTQDFVSKQIKSSFGCNKKLLTASKTFDDLSSNIQTMVGATLKSFKDQNIIQSYSDVSVRAKDADEIEIDFKFAPVFPLNSIKFTTVVKEGEVISTHLTEEELFERYIENKPW